MQERIDQALEELNAMQEELESALEEETQDEQDGDAEGEQREDQAPQDGDAQGATGASASEQQEMTRDEAQRLLQSVRDKERERRMKRAEAERTGTPITGRDW